MELAKLTPEEREELLTDLEAKESGALAGQAYKAKYVQKVSPKVLKASPTLVKQAVRKLSSSSLPSSSAPAEKSSSLLRPDLIVEYKKESLFGAFSVDYYVFDNESGKYVNLSFASVKNIGSASTGTDFHVLFTTPVGLYVQTSSALLPGEYIAFHNWGVTYPCTTPNHNVIIAADNSNQVVYQNKVLEVSETNNDYTLAITC